MDGRALRCAIYLEGWRSLGHALNGRGKACTSSSIFLWGLLLEGMYSMAVLSLPFPVNVRLILCTCNAGGEFLDRPSCTNVVDLKALCAFSGVKY